MPNLMRCTTAMGRALPRGRRRRRAGMLRKAVGRGPTARHPTRLLASGTHVGHKPLFGHVRFPALMEQASWRVAFGAALTSGPCCTKANTR